MSGKDLRFANEGGLGDQGSRPERKLSHIPGAQLPVAMTAPKTVKVMRPINSAYSMRVAPRRSRHRRRSITRTIYALLQAPPCPCVACSYMSQGQHTGRLLRRHESRWILSVAAGVGSPPSQPLRSCHRAPKCTLAPKRTLASASSARAFQRSISAACTTSDLLRLQASRCQCARSGCASASACSSLAMRSRSLTGSRRPAHLRSHRGWQPRPAPRSARRAGH